MAINNRLKCLILTALFLSGLSVLNAQNTGYFLDPNSEEPRFIQRLTWRGGVYSLYCEVIIEKEEDGEYIDYLTQITTSNYLDLSMPPGDYRFRVIPYDVLGRPSTGTEWESFEVFIAIKPELYQPGEDYYYNDKNGAKFEFKGKNIKADAQFYFVNSKGEHIVPAFTIGSYYGDIVRLTFNKNQLIDGEYEFFVVNPGGLETSLSGINYKSYREKFGLMHYVVCASIMPSFHIYGEELGFGMPYYISAQISVISCIFLNNYIGMEFTVSRFTKYDDYGYEENSFTTGYNLLFINWLPDRKGAFNFRIGVGFDMQPMDLNYTNIGVSFLYRLFMNLCVEGGINYSSPIKESTGDIQPWIGITYFF